MADLPHGDSTTVAAPMVNRGASPSLEDFAQETEDRGNVIDLLTEDQIVKAGKTALDGYKIDKDSNSSWEQEVRDALSLISRIDDEEGPKPATKNWPFEGASNVVWPVIQEAVLQFAARAYPAIIQGNDVVKPKVRGADTTGEKNKRAERVARHMSDQLLEQSPSWESDKDVMLHQLPIVGQAFDKVFWVPEEDRPDAQLVSALNIKVNRATRSLRSCPRITEEIPTYPYEIAERIALGRYREIELPYAKDKDEQKPQNLLESHIRIDLDGDGYPEPWIVTLHERGDVLAIGAGWGREDIHRDVKTILQDVQQVVGQDMLGRPLIRTTQIPVQVPGDLLRITAQRYYVSYGFIPDPAGGFYSLGFARLLAHPQAAINAVLNQIIDAAKIQNAGGGLIGGGVQFGPRGQSGEIRMNPTKWTTVRTPGDDLRKNILSFAEMHPGPSAASFQVLGLLLEAAKGTSFMSDALTGDAPRQEAVGTMLARIEQGLQVFGAAFKRIYRAMKQGYELHYDLNARYLSQEAYLAFSDDQTANVEVDYAQRDFDLAPVADPTQVTAMQRMALAQYLLQFYGQPDSNNIEIKKFALEAARIENPERFIVEPQVPPEVQEQIQLSLAELRTKIGVNVATIMEKIGKAESLEEGANAAEYMRIAQMATWILSVIDPMAGGMMNGQANGQAGMGGLVGSPAGGDVPLIPQGQGGGMRGPMGGPAALGPGGPGAGAGPAGSAGSNGAGGRA